MVGLEVCKGTYCSAGMLLVKQPGSIQDSFIRRLGNRAKNMEVLSRGLLYGLDCTLFLLSDSSAVLCMFQ